MALMGYFNTGLGVSPLRCVLCGCSLSELEKVEVSMSGLHHIPTQCQQLLDIISNNGHIDCKLAYQAGITQFHTRMFEIKEIHGQDYFAITKAYYTKNGKRGFINEYRFAKAQGELAL